MGLEENSPPLSIQSQLDDKNILFQIQTKHNASRNDITTGMIGMGFTCGGVLLLIVIMYMQDVDLYTMRSELVQAVRSDTNILYGMLFVLFMFFGIPMIPLYIARWKRYQQARKRYIGTADTLYVAYKDKLQAMPWNTISSHIRISDTSNNKAVTFFKKNGSYDELIKKMGPQREAMQSTLSRTTRDFIFSGIIRQQEKNILGYIEGVDEETITQIQKLLSTS